MFAVFFTLRAAAAPALFTFSVAQTGGDVQIVGGGTFNLAGLTPFGGMFFAFDGVSPSEDNLGAGTPAQGTSFSGLTGPTVFGDGAFTSATSSTGDFVFLLGSQGRVGLPTGYASGTTLTDLDVFTGATLTSLGITPGTYTYTYGGGAGGSLVINVAPEPSTCALLGLGVVGVGVAALRRRAA